ncbi:MAG TPA: hypothetical protein DHW02_01620 [Ktedonobacter sp.]|nr:hypothetical protein [Ktedonobacter sp.]
MELYPGVVADTSLLGGKPVIKGTRVPVTLVLGQLASGMSMEEVMYEYYLSLENIRAALGYAAQQLAQDAVYATHP